MIKEAEDPEMLADENCQEECLVGFFDIGKLLGGFIVANLGKVDDPVGFTKYLTCAAASNDFPDIDPIIEESFIAGAKESVEEEWLAEIVHDLGC